MHSDSCRAVLCWTLEGGRYTLHSAWSTADMLAFVHASCYYSFESGSGLIGRVDVSNEHGICSQFITTDTCASSYHRKALALNHGVSSLRAIRHNGMVYEFVAHPGKFISDTAILRFCAEAEKMFGVE